MLQQTTVAVVEDRFVSFLERFPDLPALARADVQEVLAAWSGLGYYRRARSLHRAARIVMERHNGRFPRDPTLLRSLPGIGPYTAGAVLSIAHGLPEPVVDGNVTRVLCRLHALEGDTTRKPLKQRLWKLSRELIPKTDPGDFNQALMELGALVCTPRDPDCRTCPLADICRAGPTGRAEEFPQPKRSVAPTPIDLAGAWLEWDDKILLVRRSERERILKGMWLFPGGEVRRLEAAPRLLARLLRQKLAADVDVDGTPCATIPHAITCYRITLHLFRARLVARQPAMPCLDNRDDNLCWFRREELTSVPLSSLVIKGLAALPNA